MRARPGDRIIMAAVTVDGPLRDGEILESRGPADGPPYLVRWSDGHVGLLYPGPGSVLQVGPAQEEPVADAPAADHDRQAGEGQGPASQVGGGRRVRDWQVRISVVESEDDTDAEVVLVADAPHHLSASGHSHRNPDDPAAPQVGDEVAVARALRRLADLLLNAAVHDIEQLTGEHDVTLRPR